MFRKEESFVLSDYGKKVLDKRLASLQTNSVNLISWDDIKNRIQGKK